MNYVIGSGPAGVACASALVERGMPVTVLDAGVDLEPEVRQRVRSMAERGPDEWTESELTSIRSASQVTLGGVPLKHLYGSDFPYREVERWIPWRTRGAATRPTLARGGFSTVWGAAVLPYRQSDIDDWPITVDELAPHYRAVASMIPLAGVRDALEPILPFYMDDPSPLEPSSQARAFHRDIALHEASLRAAGFRAGYSRLAVRAGTSAAGPGCAYCGLCLHGCPYGLIYNSASTLAELVQRGEVRHVDGVVVRRLEEKGERVRIELVSLDGREETVEADRVFVAAGVVSTARLLLQSLEAWDRPVRMFDSQYFLMPWIRPAPATRPQTEALHTLAQLFIELDDPQVSRRSVHLQVYTYNDLYRSSLQAKLGPLVHLAGPLLDRLLGRLTVIQGYFHSDESSAIELTLARPVGRDEPLLHLDAQLNHETPRTLARLVRKLRRHRQDFRAFPVSLGLAPPGRGFHSGGSFPMRRHPGDLECDLVGRPAGLRRVHLVDASVFPSVPATTITFSVMANAHRIGSSVD